MLFICGIVLLKLPTFGITYMVEIETSEKVENRAVEKVSEQKDIKQKVSKNCIKNSPLFKNRKSGIKC